MTDTQETGAWDAEMMKLGAEEAVALLCRALAEAALAAPRQPSRAAVRFGCASIEVEWPVTPTVEPVAAPPVEEPDPEIAGHVVRAGLVGTVYRAPEPGAKPFVEAGDFVEPGRQVAIIEAMKLMHPVVADVSGRVTEILVDDAEPVEYDQPLLVIEPGEEE